MQNDKENLAIIKTLSNPKRLAILRLLFRVKDHLCVNEIAFEVGISQSLASHQLAYLESRGLVSSHRVGKTMCYILEKNKSVEKLEKIINIIK
ncbi:winged helix-turn-helix transcriptional regulator [Candidatus Nomurabacteria bacterium]|nr:winged helix-turn-helix transcriptional regulator [Candidatus Nomurabacteria bacterium]